MLRPLTCSLAVVSFLVVFLTVVPHLLLATPDTDTKACHEILSKSSSRSNHLLTNHPDRVHSLPGYNQPLPSLWFSGYLEYEFHGRQVHTHYMLILAEDIVDENDNNNSEAHPGDQDSTSSLGKNHQTAFTRLGQNQQDTSRVLQTEDSFPQEDNQGHNDNQDKSQQSSSSSSDSAPPPLLYWTNGGPGASSLFGLLTELGPLILSDLSLQTSDFRQTGIPTPMYNPHSWTRLPITNNHHDQKEMKKKGAHLVLIDQPAPIGFSYCEDEPDSHSCVGLAWTDELTSENAHVALQTLYQEKFPCLQHSDLYLTGESYGGIYIPTLARRILEDNNNNNNNNNNNTSAFPIKSVLKGFAVGDGCLGTETGICGDLSSPMGFDVWPILFLAGHGQIPLQTFMEVTRACHPHVSTDKDMESDTASLASLLERGLVHPLSPECQAAIDKVHKQAGGFYEYSLYDDCTYENDFLGTPLSGAVNDYPCGGGPVMSKYLSLPQVQEALHVKSEFFSVDNAEGDFDYTCTEKDLTGFYKHVIYNTTLRVLVYNGDTDPAITSFAAQNWTSHLGLTEIQSWRPWTLDSCRRMGGYVTRYKERGSFDFLTIRGAGHMVPTYKSEATFAFLKAWINGEDYPKFDKECQRPQ